MVDLVLTTVILLAPARAVFFSSSFPLKTSEPVILSAAGAKSLP